MASSYKDYTGDGSTTQFSITFDYQKESEISVTVDGVAESGLTFPSSSTVQLTSAPASSTLVRVKRTTDLSSREVDFASGSVLTEEDLDNSNIQVFHAAQEAIDTANDSISLNDDDKWGAQSKVIKNVATPVNANDAANKGYVDTGADNAASSATAASASATTASTKASEASTSASNAATSATASETAKTASQAAQTASETAQTASETAKTGAETAKTGAETAKTASETAKTGAETAKTAAETAKTGAETAKTGAETAKTGAETAKTGAETAKTAAEAAQVAAELAADNFDDVYLGNKSSDPTVDNDGDALTAGDLYFNTTSNELKVYNGSAWQVAAVSVAGLLTSANNLSDVASASTARTNLGLGTAATTASTDYATVAQGALADSALQSADIGVSAQAYDADTAKLDVAQTFTAAQRGSTDTDTTNTGSVTLDFGANQNFVLTLTGNVTLANPTTEAVGQSGFITFIQDATGGRTLSLGTDYETAGAAGITLSSTASTTDIVPYVVVASGRILLGAPQLAFS